MCLAPKPKIAKVEAPIVPPSPAETATGIRESSNRTAAALAGKRRGVRALVIERSVAGINAASPVAGLKL